MSGLAASTSAARKSSSALRIHSRVVLFIEDFSLCHDLGQERLALFQTPLYISRLQNNQVHRELCGDFATDLERLVKLVPCRHDDKEVHIAVGVRRSVSMRTEQNNAVGLEALRDTARVTAYDAHGNIASAIPA